MFHIALISNIFVSCSIVLGEILICFLTATNTLHSLFCQRCYIMGVVTVEVKHAEEDTSESLTKGDFRSSFGLNNISFQDGKKELNYMIVL